MAVATCPVWFLGNSVNLPNPTLFFLLSQCCGTHSNSVVALTHPAGIQLLPESYAVLIFAALEATPPDVAMAKALYGGLAGTDTDLQLPWSTLVRLLAAKGCAADAVAAVKEGLRAGLTMDADVAEAYVKALCDSGQSVSVCLGVFGRLLFQRAYVHCEDVAQAYVKAPCDSGQLVSVAGGALWQGLL